MFERTLQDLIRGLRAHKASSRAQEDAFLNEAMGEIRDELKGKDMALKAEAVLKMCYVSVLATLEGDRLGVLLSPWLVQQRALGCGVLGRVSWSVFAGV